MWNKLLTGILAVACVALTVALARGGSGESSPRVLVAARPALAVGTEPMPAPAPPSPAERMLDRRIDALDFDGRQTLENAIRVIADATNSNFSVDWRSLEAQSIDRTTTVRAQPTLKNVTVREALKQILIITLAVKLGFRADGELILISTEEELAKATRIVVYNVRDLLGAIMTADKGHASSQEAADALTKLITDMVEPATWAEGGGTGAVRELMGLLVIAQTPENQEEVATLLHALRDRSRTAPPASVPADPQARKAFDEMRELLNKRQ